MKLIMTWLIDRSFRRLAILTQLNHPPFIKLSLKLFNFSKLAVPSNTLHPNFTLKLLLPRGTILASRRYNTHYTYCRLVTCAGIGLSAAARTHVLQTSVSVRHPATAAPNRISYRCFHSLFPATCVCVCVSRLLRRADSPSLSLSRRCALSHLDYVVAGVSLSSFFLLFLSLSFASTPHYYCYT